MHIKEYKGALTSPGFGSGRGEALRGLVTRSTYVSGVLTLTTHAHALTGPYSVNTALLLCMSVCRCDQLTWSRGMTSLSGDAERYALGLGAGMCGRDTRAGLGCAQ